MSIIVNHRSKKSEKNACDLLHRRFYGDVGKYFLGWKVADGLLMPDGSAIKLGADCWQHWKSKHIGERDNLVWDHLKGLNRGIVATEAEFIPCISAECDRHHRGISPADHCRAVMTMARYLVGRHPHFNWVAEVNPKNGSTKFFGFLPKTPAIPIATAKEISKQIHDDLLPFIGNRECFPFNCKAVGLPMRTGKTTIISNGTLPMVERKKMVNGSFERFQTYSAVAFLRGISTAGRQFNVETLKQELLQSCRNQLPVKEIKPKTTTAEPIVLKSGKRFVELKDIANEPDAFKRLAETLRFLCRKSRRVVSTSELLSAYRDNELYSGEWSDNERKREAKARGIVRYTAQTFDPKKCGEGKSTRAVLNERMRDWRGKLHHFVSGARRLKLKRLWMLMCCCLRSQNEKSPGPFPGFFAN